MSPNIPNLSFFIYRKINDVKDNIVWVECVKQIRNFYKYEPIFIIDDCNDKNIIIDLNNIKGLPIFNIHFLNTEDEKDVDLKGCGELACYYFYFKLKVSTKAIIIQDSFFLLKPLDNNLLNTDIRFLLGFIDNQEFSKSLVNNLILELNNGHNIIDYKYKYNWVGCFGLNSLISINYLIYLHNTYHIFNLINDVKFKLMREVLERAFGLLITYDKKNFNDISFFGLKGIFSYDLNNYFPKKDELIINDIPYFNYHQHQLE